ncbi:septum formation initiator family protein [Paenibacillus sp. 19GGS1-52]|uniref:FtsB family cell division protein n=1 Tax=Paenibacillus sp. 19GGS1-52 TaxID=2758563 RepID=UPI001EFABCA8|nr:septum formation initiator family protein [Paenibacillus sp. 19GGS1-52]ULO07514.1 septum formation initiator family protein [Paenibacillus sp. 19GGS1-52]
MNRFSAEEKANNSKSSAAGAKRRRVLWTLFIAVFFGWAGYVFFAQSALIADKSSQLAKKQETSESVTASLNQLKYEVSRLNDDEYIGQLARKWYNIYPQGETPIRTEQSK